MICGALQYHILEEVVGDRKGFVDDQTRVRACSAFISKLPPDSPLEVVSTISTATSCPRAPRSASDRATAESVLNTASSVFAVARKRILPFRLYSLIWAG